MQSSPELIPVREYCRSRGIGTTTLYKLLNEGSLVAVKVGSKTLITAESDRAWRASLPTYQPQAAA